MEPHRMNTDPIAERAREVLIQHIGINELSPTQMRVVARAMVAFAALTTESRPEGLERECVAVRQKPADSMLETVRTFGPNGEYIVVRAWPNGDYSVFDPASPNAPRVQTDAPASGEVPKGMVAYSPEHPDYPNAPKDWDGKVVQYRRLDGSLHLLALSDESESWPTVTAYTTKPLRDVIISILRSAIRLECGDTLRGFENAADRIIAYTSTPSEGARDSALEEAVQAIRAERDRPLQGPEHGAWDRGRQKGLDEAVAIVAASRTAKPEQAGAGEALRVALDRAVLFSAYNRNDPQAIRFVFRSDEDRLTAANAVDALLAAPQGQNSGEGAS